MRDEVMIRRRLKAVLEELEYVEKCIEERDFVCGRECADLVKLTAAYERQSRLRQDAGTLRWVLGE